MRLLILHLTAVSFIAWLPEAKASGSSQVSLLFKKAR
nr:MAG TPA: hypothetical protein [Caudoviricetes sp.]